MIDPADLYPAEVVDHVGEALDLGPVILTGVPGTARRAVAAAAGGRRLRAGPTVTVDPARAGTLAALQVDVARQLVAIALGDPTPDLTYLPPRHLAAVQRMAGPDSAALIASARNESRPLELSALLELTRGEMRILVLDAPLLDRRWARDALWSLRGRATDGDAPAMLLLARPHQTLDGPAQAFLGTATNIELRPPSSPVLLEKLAEHGRADERADWAAAARGLPGVVATALALGDGNGERGWQILLAVTERRLSVYRRLALEAHQLGPRLIDAIARARPPYGSVPGAAPALVSNALSALRDAELITQPAPRRWRLADPALEHILSR